MFTANAGREAMVTRKLDGDRASCTGSVVKSKKEVAVRQDSLSTVCIEAQNSSRYEVNQNSDSGADER